MLDIDGKPRKLSALKGSVLLVVNVASKCGNTPQYTALEKLYKQRKEEGLVVLGFPANEFRGQEPGTNAEIKEFCTLNYGVTFPMFSKIVAKGSNVSPLYKWLVASSNEPEKEIQWNFEKFLIGRDGKVVARFAPKTQPDDPAVVDAIEAALAQR
jgi:glutathione peroxidase